MTTSPNARVPEAETAGSSEIRIGAFDINSHAYSYKQPSTAALASGIADPTVGQVTALQQRSNHAGLAEILYSKGGNFLQRQTRQFRRYH